MDEKHSQSTLPNGSDLVPPVTTRTRKQPIKLKAIVISLGLMIFFVFKFSKYSLRPCLRGPSNTIEHEDIASQCPAQYAIAPQSHPEITERNLNTLFPSAEFRNLSVSRLSGAVQIPTVSYDDNGPIGQDQRWEVFFELEQYFRDTFPLLHEKLEREIVNTHGLVYTWYGSDPSLKPILLTGHQDVVPIQEDTLSDWTYPPFSGYFDGKYINGRGAHDCKNNVIAILSAVEALLEAGFNPIRTVVLGFGFDEESPTLMLGAYPISRHLKHVWGTKFEDDTLPFALLLDEGLIGISKKYNRTFGTPQASEKGMLDVKFRVHVPGGHSSTPPAHTSIGILSQAVTALEDSYRSNFPSRFTSNNPFYYEIQCAAEDPHADLPSELRGAILNQSGRSDVDHPELTALLVKQDPESDIYLHTSQAVTIFNSGNKANVIPANAEMLANYRISNEESISTIQKKIVQTINPIAEKFNLTLIVREEDDDQEELPVNSLSISWWRRIEPSPVSTHQHPVWNHLAGVIKHVFDKPGEGNDVIVAPTMAVGNTDTKYYWDLSEQIYRFGPLRIWHDEGWGNLHSVNERIALDAHLESLVFFHELIRVFDESDLTY